MYMNVQYLSVLFLSLQNKGGSIVFKIEMIVQTAWGGKSYYDKQKALNG